MNLPETYAAVCAKRPELAVAWLGRSTNIWVDDHPPITVWIYGPTPATSRAMLDGHAAALILARWVEALPVYRVLAQMLHDKWQVFEMGIGGDYTGNGADLHPTPLEALAAYWLEETT